MLNLFRKCVVAATATLKRAPAGADIAAAADKRLALPAALRKAPWIPGQSRRRVYPAMLVPERTVLVWEYIPEPDTGKKKKRPPGIDDEHCVSMLFDVDVAGKSLQVSLKRPVVEKFTETRDKIGQKVGKLLLGKPKKAKKGEALSEPPALPSFHFQPDVAVEEGTSVGDVLLQGSASTVLINSLAYRIVREPLDVASLQLSQRCIAGAPAMPAINYRQNCMPAGVSPVLHWYVTERTGDQPPETIKLEEGEERRFSVVDCEYRATGLIYTPTKEDKGKRLVVVCDLGEGTIVRCAVAKTAIETLEKPALYEGRLLHWKEKARTEGSTRVVSFNVLADLYLNLSGPQEELFFPYCIKEFQQCEYRYPLVLSEIQAYAADLYCLQEVDYKLYIRYLKEVMKEMNCGLEFAKKAREVNEGCVVAWREDRFSLVSSDIVVLSDSLEESSNSDLKTICQSSEKTWEVVSTRPTVLQLVCLRDSRSGDMWLVGNTHLHHHPKDEQVKAVQAALIVREMERRKRDAVERGEKVRVYLCGDLNSTPHGPVVRMLEKGKLEKDDECWQLDKHIKADDIVIPGAWHNVSGVPEFTNYTRGFVECIDYIWSDCEVGGVDVLPVPSREEAAEEGALPNRRAPSDHVALVCQW